jgi:hypothetical protein
MFSTNFSSHISNVIVGEAINVSLYGSNDEQIDLVIEAPPLSMKSLSEKYLDRNEEIIRKNDNTIKIGSSTYTYKLSTTFCGPSSFADVSDVDIVALRFVGETGFFPKDYILSDGIIDIDEIYKIEKYKKYKKEVLPEIVGYFQKNSEVCRAFVRDSGIKSNLLRIPVSSEVLTRNKAYFDKYGPIKEVGDQIVISSTNGTDKTKQFIITYNSSWHVEAYPSTLKDGKESAYPRRSYTIIGSDINIQCTDVEKEISEIGIVKRGIVRYEFSLNSKSDHFLDVVGGRL